MKFFMALSPSFYFPITAGLFCSISAGLRPKGGANAPLNCLLKVVASIFD